MTKMGAFFGFILILLIGPQLQVYAQELAADEHTLLLLHFNNQLSGVEGETPAQAGGVTFEKGVFGNGAYFPVGNRVYYPSKGNINSTQGTLEFWIKPRWNGNDGQNYFVLRYRVAGGMLFGKDGANNWRCIFNRFSVGGISEIGAGFNVSQWRANEWHHCAFTWNNTAVKLYIDGKLRSEVPVVAPLPIVDEPSFQLGADGDGAYLDAVMDELRISAVARTANEIASNYLVGLSISGLVLQPTSLKLLETWSKAPTVLATTDTGKTEIPPSQVVWTSSNPAIASVDKAGRITAHKAGVASITAKLNPLQTSMQVIVTSPVRPPEVDVIDPYLAAPASGYLYQMPVVVIRYLPTIDGINVDAAIADWNSSLADLKRRIDVFNKRVKFMLEEGSRYRGYKDASAIPSLGYRVVHIVTVYEEMPEGKSTGTPGVFFPDYYQILTRFGAERFVNTLGVKEFWLWGYHHGNIVPAESNMSSPVTGDISNSFRFNDDLPIFKHTYTLYNYNFTRSQNEAVHNHGHQLEAILSHANQLQDGNADLFWKKFVGQDENGNFITGRCGWTHMPPNTTEHYDYANPIQAASDIENWTPAGTGSQKLINVDRWGRLPYQWPSDDLTIDPPNPESQWYIYWMQNMPGRGNTIQYGNHLMTNWRTFTGDWDAAISSKLGLYAPKMRKFGLTIPQGISLVHIPLMVTRVNEKPMRIKTVGELFDALGGPAHVNFLITHDTSANVWRSYLGTNSRGTAADRRLADDTGIIAVMKTPVTLDLTGQPLGSGGKSQFNLNSGTNLIGVPLKSQHLQRVSALLNFDGIKDNVTAIIVADAGAFKVVARPGDDGDIPLTGGQAFVIIARQPSLVALGGEPWGNVSDETLFASAMRVTGYKANGSTPILAVHGNVVGSFVKQANGRFHLTVKNLSTRTVLQTDFGDGGSEGSYNVTFVNFNTRGAAQVGDVLEIVVETGRPRIGVQPLRHTVSTEEVTTSRIQLLNLLAYEIPTETKLLSNYPNPFNPETWVPYNLAESAFVNLVIYDTTGTVIRIIQVGHKQAAVYHSKDKAIYWDGRNDFGERVASGIYFYTLTANKFTDTRKMVIIK